jgi:hypothetical protein
MLTKSSVSRPLYLEAEDIRKKVETCFLDYCGFTVNFVRWLSAGKFIFFLFAGFAAIVKPESPKRTENQDVN